MNKKSPPYRIQGYFPQERLTSRYKTPHLSKYTKKHPTIEAREGITEVFQHSLIPTIEAFATFYSFLDPQRKPLAKTIQS